MLFFAVDSQEEFAVYRQMVFLFAFILFMALFRIAAWMVGFLIGGWLEAYTAGFYFGRDVESRRNEEDDSTER